MNLTLHQLEELSAATRGVVGVLTGAPGTGKTTTLAWLIRRLTESPGRGEIAVCAPTGKAAVRITESLSGHGLNIKAATIHSTLGVQSCEDGGWSFVHGESCKLPQQFIFVDECSMIDADLMRSLLSARGTGTHMLFVGDPHQLPPVGHGAPFRDFISAGVPSGHLSEIHRNAGRIVRTCSEIRQAPHRFNVSPALDLDSGENLVVAAASGGEQQLAELRNQIDQASMRGLDPTWDVQVIVPLNESGGLSRKTLNRELQGFLNPSGQQISGAPFRLNDKVVCLKNSLAPAAPGCPAEEQSDDGKVYVANGEQAKVVRIEPARTIVQLTSPRRLAVIPHGRRKEGGEEAATGDWDLAYAISCHKSQGSEWPVVIVMADESGGARFVGTREWVTTAISRAKKYCVVVGKRGTMQGFCRRSGLWNRKTFLVEKFHELEMEVCNEA